MRESLQYRNPVRAGIYLVLFFGGLLMGIGVVQMQGNSAFSGIFSEYFLNQYASLKIDAGRLLRYVGGYRSGQYALLVCCGALTAAPVIVGVLLFAFGMTWGTMLSVSTLRLGLKGVLLCVAGVLPQIFFYLPAFGWILLWILQRGSSRRKYLFLTAAGFFFLLFGILVEVYINPLILQQILRKMS